MRITRRIMTWSLALALIAPGIAQAATYYYYRGGAQATEPSGTKPTSPAPQGTFAILVDAPEVGIRGAGYSATTYAYSNVGPVVFSVYSGSLPAGISINATTGTISGTPTAIGTSSVVIQGVDTSTNAAATTTLTIEVNDPFSISGTPGALVQKNTPYSADFTLAGGGQPYGFSVGALAPGLAFNAGATTANIGGIPTTAGTYNITVTGSDKHGLVAQYPYTLQVFDVLTIAGAPPATATVGTPYSGQLTVTGGAAPFTYTIAAGTLPAGVTLKTSGVISGTPSFAGVKSGIRVKVSDATGQSATSAPFSIAVAATGSQPLTISVVPVTTGRENKAYATQYTAGGGSGSYSFSMVGGALPQGLTFNANSGLISGAPLNGSAGTYPDITAKVVDTASQEAVSTPFTLTIAQAQIALSITGTPPTSVQVSTPYAAQFSGHGGTGAGYVFALASGTLPPGLSLSPTGMLSGTPGTTGTYSNLRVRVTDNASNTALSNTFTINVVAPPPLVISGVPASTVTAGNSYSATWTAFDGSGAGYHYTSVGGTLPPGLALSDINGAQGLLSGIATTAGTYPDLRIQVVDSLGNTATSSPFSITVEPPPPPPVGQTPLALFGTPADAVYGQAYSVTFSGGGGSPSYVYSITGTLPDGLTLDPFSGVLSGTPNQIGNFPGLQVTVTDSNNDTASSAVFAINVADPNPLSISWTPQTNWQVNDFVAILPDTVGGDSNNYSYSTIGTVPPGLSLFSNGTLFGTLTEFGTFGPFQIQVTDGVRTATTQAVTFEVAAPGLFVSGFPAANADENQAYSAQFSAQGGTGAGYVYSMNGTLPAGLSLDPSTGLIAGTPAIGSAGTYANLSVRVTDDANTSADSALFSIEVHPLPTLVVVGTPPTTSTLGGNYSTVFAATGGTSTGYVFSIDSGTLPSGLTLAADGALSGSPTAAGTFGPIIVKVTDSANLTAQSAPFSIEVVDDNPLSISWAPTTVYAIGDTVSITSTPAGGVPENYVFGYTGTLPTGVTQNPATGALSGAANSVGTFGPITVTVTDGLRNAATMPVTFTVNGVIAITGTPSAYAAVGVPYSAQFSATGGTGTGLVYASTGAALPTGLTIDTTTGTISGTPTDVGTWSFSVRLTDALGTAGTPTGVYSITVAGSAAPAAGTGGSCGGLSAQTNATLAVLPSTPGTVLVDPCWGYPYRTGASGYLAQVNPSALTQVVPSTVGASPGPVSFACDGPIVYPETQTFSMANGWTTIPAIRSCNVYSAPVVTPAFLNQLAAGNYQYVVVYPITDNGNGRALVIWNDAKLGPVGPRQQGIARISGMQFQYQYPSKTHSWISCEGICYPTGGTFTYANDDTIGQYLAQLSSPERNSTVRAYLQAPNGGVAWEGVPTTYAAIIHDDWLRQTATPSPSGNYASSVQAGSAYSSQISGSGTWSLASGSLPPGLSLNASTGAISGIPTVTGTYNFTVVVSANGIASTPSAAQAITVSAATVSAALNASTIRAGGAFSGTLSSSMPSPTWSLSSTLSITVSGNTFSGTAASAGSFTITPTASANGYTQSGSAATLNVVGTFGIGAAGNISGNAGLTMSANGPAAFNKIGTASYVLLQNGSAANLGALCPGLSFSASTAVISGQPTTTCSQSNFSVRATDSYDGQSATSNAFSISIGGFVVQPASSTYTVTGSFPVPVYNTITIEIWGGGASGGVTATTGQGYDGNATTIPAYNLVAGGGRKSTATFANRAPASAGGTASGGNLANIPGNAGGLPSPLTSAFGYSGKGGDAPYGGVGGAAIYKGDISYYTVAGNPGQAPGGGGGGSAYAAPCGDICTYKYPGGGSGGYVKHVIRVTDPGAPAFGSSIGFTIGAATPSGAQSNGAGARGQATFTIN